MIILILGGVGTGKTLSAVREIVDQKQYALTNFNIKPNKGIKHHRIKFEDIIKKVPKDKDGKKFEYKVNWEFWEDIRKKHKNYSIYLDEIHNIIHARRSMTKTNILMSKWISQIRKILSDNPDNHIYLISQTIRKIDVDFRELANVVLLCQKRQVGNETYIIQYWFNGVDSYLYGRNSLKIRFVASRYYEYYNTNEMVRFTDAEVYI